MKAAGNDDRQAEIAQEDLGNPPELEGDTAF